MTELVDCLICNDNSTTFIANKGRNNIPMNLVLCNTCGLGYLNPRWTKNKYIDFYTNEYDKYYRASVFDDEKLKQSLSKNVIEDRLKKFNLLPNRLNSVLEIGSGEGANIIYFKHKYPGIECYAIEPSAKSQEFLIKFDIKILTTDADDEWDKKQQKFDLIILRHVIEHLQNPVEVLKKVRNSLTSDGKVYIAVPNCFKATSNVFNRWFRVVHTYYYNRHTLKTILEKSGLKVEILEEGDVHNELELFTVASVKEDYDFTIHNSYRKQLQFFQNGILHDKKIVNRVKQFFVRILKNLS